MGRVIVTSALPYANGPIHFGHVVGAYLPADIYVRYRRMLGDDVHFVCGTDEHGVAITLKAEQAGVSYEEYVDRWHREIADTLAAMNVRFDIFSGTAHHRNPFHRPLAQRFFLDLLREGYLIERTEEQFFAPQLGRFLPDRYVEGTCYRCGHEGARGDECPGCGAWLDAKKLRDPRSILDGSTPVLKPSKHWYLDLPKLRDEFLEEWFHSKLDEWKPNVRNFVKGALEDLRERPITRDLPWGVPVPLPGAEGKVLYVWFDAPIGYLSISQQYFHEQGRPERFEALWKDPSTELYHFIGKDNITFHVVVFPAMLYGTKAGWILPANVPANEFFNLEGKKFNTSKGWYIPEESVRGRFPVDALRYALTTMMPETADSDWSWREFQARVNDDLADNLGNFVARTLRFVERFLGGELPAREEPRSQDREVFARAAAAVQDVERHLGRFEFRKTCQRLMEFCSDCNRYFDQQQPWATRRTDPDSAARTLRVCVELVHSIGVLCRPILPETSDRILEALGGSSDPRLADASGPALPAGALRPRPLPILFAKVEDEVVERELARLREMAVAAEAAAATAEPPEPIAETVPFDTFAAVDLRAATIVEARKHEKADRLLVCKVDLGFEQRTVVAGIAAAYTPEELVGRRVVLVANLAPRRLRGVESQGMLLAADDDQGLPRLIAPDPGTPDGVRIR